MLRFGRGKLIAAAIIAFWVVMMGLLIQREGLVSRPEAPVDGEALLVPREAWLGVFLPSGEQAGFININSAPREEAGARGFDTRLTAQLRLQVLGRTVRILVRGESWTHIERGLQAFDLTVRSNGSDFRVDGRIEGDQLLAAVHTAGEAYPLAIPVDRTLLMGTGMGTTLGLPPLAVGESATINAFDPITLSTGQTRIACVGEESIETQGQTVTAQVLEVTTSGVTSKAWVTPQGDLIRAETPFGFILQRMDPQTASANLPPRESADLLAMASVRPSGVPVHPGLTRMRARIGGVPESRTLPSDDTQTFNNGSALDVVVPASPANPMPVRDTGTERAAYLEADAFIQAEHPRIVEQAQAIAGDVADRWEAAQRLNTWLYNTLEKTAVVSIPSALEVLGTKQGDCNEHTVLFTALARSLGIPTRIAVGLVWSDTYNGFYYHAWPEVYVGRWVWVDPTLGQPIADATHIKLLEGGIRDWPQLLPFLGSIQIDVLEAQ